MSSKEDDDPRLLRFRKMSRPVRVVYARPRTFISILVGIAAFFLLPGSLRLVTRLLIGWGGFVAPHGAAQRAAAYPAQRGAAGRRPLSDFAGDGARRVRQHRRHRVRTRGVASQRPGTDVGDSNDRAVMGGGTYHLRLALRP